jgi:alkanesulfonate monooxygenase SsuD/methylene tetrahydromethanopterin reductase-like flavin-dependent oxidoreductase (luciferase family)
VGAHPWSRRRLGRRRSRRLWVPADDRVGRFEEALQIIVPLLRGQTVTFEGRYHTARDAVLRPPPERRIPVLVAAGRPKMLRLTGPAQGGTPAAFGGECGVEHGQLVTQAIVRKDVPSAWPSATLTPASLSMASSTAFSGSVDEVARAFDTYAALGIDDLIVGLEPRNERSLDRLAKAIPLRRTR